MQPAGRPVGRPLRREAYVQRKARPSRITEFCLCYHRRRDPLAVGEATCEAAAAASAAACIEELLKSRRATAGVDGEEFTRLLGDDDADDGDSSPDADGDLSLANLPAEPNAIFLADGCCSGVAAGSDGLPAAAGLLDGDLRRLILVSGDDSSNFGERPFSIASFLSNEFPNVASACFELSQSKKVVKNAGSSPSATAYTVVSIERRPS